MTFDTTLRPDPFIGRSFGPYRLTERIREVRVGAAFIAEHRHLDRHVVLKLFQPAPPGTAGGGLPSVEARLRALSRSWHEHVVPLVDVAEGDDGLVFVTLGLEDDVPLTSLSAVGDGAVPWPRARMFARQIAGAIRWAEGQGIPLGELTPAQVFLSLGRGRRAAGRARIDLVTPETLGLVAPPARVDWAFDLGRILYRLVTGHSPEAGADGPPTDPVLKRPDLDVPGEADALIMRALDPDPTKRWPDLASLHRALGGRDDEIEGSATPARRPTGTGAGAPAGAAWFASEREAGADPAAVDLLDSPGPAGADPLDQSGELGDLHDDGRADRFNLDFDSDDDGGGGHHGSFGTRSLFARPSRRAMISVTVAGVAALAVAVMMIRARGHSTNEREDGQEAAGVATGGAGPAPAPAVAGPPPGDPGSAGAPGAALAAGEPAGMAGAPPTEGAEAAHGAQDGAPGGAPPVVATSQPPAGPSNPAAAGQGGGGALPDGPSAGAPSARGASRSTAVLGPAPGTAAAGSAGNGGGSTVVAGPGAGSGTATGVQAASAPPPSAPTPEVADRSSPVPSGAAPSGPASVTGAAAAAPVAEASGRCSLSLGSKPWADVWIDGRRAGLTPLTDFPIACGAHEVVFTSTDLGVERRISVDVQPGDRTPRTLDLEAPQVPVADSMVAPAAPARAARPECRLSLGSRPWSEVWIDGRRAGVTPLVSVAVRCGRHDVLFVSREANVERRETIFVAEGQNVKRIVTLVEGE